MYAQHNRKRAQFFITIVFLVILLLISMMISISFGTVTISLSEIISIIKSGLLKTGEYVGSAAHYDIIWSLRIPRVLLAATVGAGLALCGTIMQASVQNPLAEPFIMGIASGASLGAVTAVLVGGIIGVTLPMGIVGFAFIGAILATWAVLNLASGTGNLTTVKLVLAGAVISALCTAGANFIIYTAQNMEGIQTVTFWNMGSLAGAKWETIWIPLVTVGVCIVYFLCRTRTLNALLLGEEAAITIGVDVQYYRWQFMLIISLMTGILVSQCGVIGFVGLVIPHGTRIFVGTTHERLLPVILFVGAIFLVWCDLVSRTLLPQGDLPIGIITALTGAPLFMYLLFRRSMAFGGER